MSALPWNDFETLFNPISRRDGSLLRDVKGSIPASHIGHWWTVVEEDGLLFLVAGIWFVNRIGYVKTRVAWSGSPEDQPVYRYDGGLDG